MTNIQVALVKSLKTNATVSAGDSYSDATIGPIFLVSQAHG